MPSFILSKLKQFVKKRFVSFKRSCNQPKKPPVKMQKGPFVGCIDEGTSSTRFILFDANGIPVITVQKPFEQIYPKQGWCEHNPEEIYKKTIECIEEAGNEMLQNGMDPKDCKAIGITNQRETTVVWSKKTGKPLNNALVWLDTRTKDIVQDFIKKTPNQESKYFIRKCGLPLSTYFSALKLSWLLQNVEVVKKAHENDDLMFGTIDSWLLYVRLNLM